MKPVLRGVYWGWLLTVTFACVPLCSSQTSPGSWQAEVRERVAAKQPEAALNRVEQRLREAPGDLEARGWRARLLAWTGRWDEAEREYRIVLEAAPTDADILLGLSDVLFWKNQYAESLALIDRAKGQDPRRVEIHMRRGRVLRAMGRMEEASAAFSEALRLEPGNAEAKAALDSLAPEPRHELRISSDFDHYDFVDDAQGVTLGLRSHVGSKWITNVGGSFQRRFDEKTGSFLGSVTYRITPQDSITAGGGVAGRHAGVVPKGDAFFEYGRGIRLEQRGAIRGLELVYNQHWIWYRDARLLVITPSMLVYLPRDWTWFLSLAVARTRFSGIPAEWRPSGRTRLSFPLHRRLSGNLFFGVGTENFAQLDQLGRFSARTFGGGARWQIARRHELSGYVFYQDRSQGRAQTGWGLSYAFRF